MRPQITAVFRIMRADHIRPYTHKRECPGEESPPVRTLGRGDSCNAVRLRAGGIPKEHSGIIHPYVTTQFSIP